MDPSAPPLPQPATIQEKLKEFDGVPLFMRSLPEGGDADVAVSALQSLVHEGTPDEIAENFKDQGNDYFRGKRYKEARNFYTQGIDATPKDRPLLQALLCNRAACNLELENYGYVLRDCSRAISLNPHSSKAHYRSSLALLALERFEEALDCCSRCLDFDPSNTSVQILREKARKEKETREKREHEKKERLRREAETKHQLELVLQARNIITINNPNVTDDYYTPYLAVDPNAVDPRLIVPMFFLYPQYATSDLIAHYDEETPFRDHLDSMFPSSASDIVERRPSWDKEAEYLAPNLVVYAMTHRRRLLKVGKKMTLLDVCRHAKGNNKENDGLELKNGCLSVVILPQGKVENRWVEDFKAGRNT